MNNLRPAQRPLLSRLKQLIAELFRMDLLEPDKIADYAPLIGGSLGLDSLDLLELAFCVEESFGVALCHRDGSLRSFTSIAGLADFIDAQMQTRPTVLHPHRLADVQIVFEALTSPSPV